MKLVHVDRNGEDTTAKFKLEDGNLATVDPSTLSEEDAIRVLAWKPTPDTEGFFDYMFDGNLVVLDGESFTTHNHDPKPVKYYAFYYTASWCGPCIRFTPTLVDFYKKNKNANFEIILVSADRNEQAMLGYAQKAKMPWPQINFEKTRGIRGMLDHGVRGIPALIVCDAKGNNLGNFRSNLEGLAELIK
jgi:thiol-disulfide isomerase/thioredoxin